METFDPISMLPPEWVALAAPWAMRAVAALLVTTAIAHALLPIARAASRWAATSPATWDDGPARWIADKLEWLVGACDAIVAYLPRLAIGRTVPKPKSKAKPERLGVFAATMARTNELPPPPPDPPRRIGELRAGDIADRVVGCVDCGKPSALVGERIPADGLCRWCRDEDPPGPGPVSAVGVLLIAVAVSLVTSACGMTATEAARHGLAGTARIGAELDRDLAAERLRVSAEIRGRADATREEHDAAMVPFDEALAITVDVRDAHLAAEAGLDAFEHGEDRAWRPLMTCLFSSLSRLVGIAARRITIPPEAGEVLQLLAGLAEGACPEPEDDASDEPAQEGGR